MARPMGRPPTRLRTPAQIRDYARLMDLLGDLQRQRHQADMQRVGAALIDLYAPQARAILAEAFSRCTTLAEAYALACEIDGGGDV